jgi:hypothetical protein
VTELGNLTAGILLSLQRMSTVKIRARSRFRIPMSRIGAEGAGSGTGTAVGSGTPDFARRQNPGRERFSSALHSLGRAFTVCTQASAVSDLREDDVRVQSQLIQFKN